MKALSGKDIGREQLVNCHLVIVEQTERLVRVYFRNEPFERDG